MVKKVIANPGPFPISKAVLHNHKYTLEVSGQIGTDTKTGELVEGIENQTAKTLEIIKNILQEEGWKLSNVDKARVYLSDMKNYEKMNETYKKYFTAEYPARVALAVKELPRKALVEIECTASGDKIKD